MSGVSLSLAPQVVPPSMWIKVVSGLDFGSYFLEVRFEGECTVQGDAKVSRFGGVAQTFSVEKDV